MPRPITFSSFTFNFIQTSFRDANFMGINKAVGKIVIGYLPNAYVHNVFVDPGVWVAWNNIFVRDFLTEDYRSFIVG